MLTVDLLKAQGVCVEEGLARCMKNETLYLRLVNMALKDAGFGKLESALGAGDLEAAFDAAHGLKGILGNLSLTPMYTIIAGMTEALRNREEKDYSADLEKLLALREKWEQLAQ